MGVMGVMRTGLFRWSISPLYISDISTLGGKLTGQRYQAEVL